MSKDEIKELFALLERAGWDRDASKMISPRGTISLDIERPWDGTVQDHQAKLRIDIERIRNNQSSAIRRESGKNLLLDSESLLNCIELILRSEREV